MKKMNDENDFKMRMMTKVGLFPKIYWLKKHNDAIYCRKSKMMEEASMVPSKKKKEGRGGGKKQDESADEGCQHVAEQIIFWCK
jgi:hypothetical protein